MVDTKVETVARLARWKIESFVPTETLNYKISDPFKIGIRNWGLAANKSTVDGTVSIRLFPQRSQDATEQPLIARFVLRVTASGVNQRPYISPIEVKLFRRGDYFCCNADIYWPGPLLIIDVEFLNLIICPPSGGEGTPIPICRGEDMVRHLGPQSCRLSRMINESVLTRMLNESVLTDITINTADGKLQAHKAILSASSPVFHSMFIHDLKEKESSIIEIEDMTCESCAALLSYFYGTINQDDFWKHRWALLRAAHKYDIIYLKDACEESLLEDVDSRNVLERLQEAGVYELKRLKKGCLMYLFDFGKIYDVREEMNDFFKNAEREVVMEMFQELLAVCKPTEAASFLALR